MAKQIGREQVYDHYFRMESRSIKALHKELTAAGWSISESTLNRWSKGVYRSWFLGHFVSGNHAAAPVLGKSAWRTAAGVRWPWRSASHASL